MRLGRASSLTELPRRILLRPELTAVLGTLAVFVYFAVTAGDSGFLTETSAHNSLEVAAKIGIIAAPMTLLIVAGEFDLSVGATVGASQILASYLIVLEGWPVGLALAMTVVVAALIGLLNGVLVVVTGVPSLMITLGAMFWIRGTSQGLSEAEAGRSTIAGIRDEAGDGFVAKLVGGSFHGYGVSVLWLLIAIAVCAWLLDRTPVGNRIYATGGNPEAARRSGVASARLKVWLYMWTAVAASLVGVLTAFTINQGDVNSGTGLEFQTAAAVVIGGAALWGGFGSPIGAGIGAILFGMVTQGFFFTSVPDVYYQTFLGVILVVAVVVNERTRLLLMRPRRYRREE